MIADESNDVDERAIRTHSPDGQAEICINGATMKKRRYLPWVLAVIVIVLEGPAVDGLHGAQANDKEIALIALRVRELFERHSLGWPETVKDGYVELVTETLQDCTKDGRLPRTWCELLLDSLDHYMGTLPTWDKMTPPRVDLKYKYIECRIRAFFELGPPAHQVKERIAQQNAEAVEIAEQWLVGNADVPATVSRQALDAFRTGLSKFANNVLVTAYLRALEEQEQQELLRQWRDHLRAVNVAEDFTWVKGNEERARLLGMRLSHFFRFRKRLGPQLPKEISDELQTYYASWMEDERERRELQEFENEQRRIHTVHAPEVQVYECVGSLLNSIGLVHSETSVPGLASTVAFLPSTPIASLMATSQEADVVSIPFTMRVSRHETADLGDETLESEMTGVIFYADRLIRLEIVSRFPSWRGAGLIYEPIGLTVVINDCEVKWYSPGQFIQDVRSLSLNVDSQPAAEVARNDVFRACFLNRLRFAQGKVDVCDSSNISKDLTLKWDPPEPCVYNATIREGQLRHSPDRLEIALHSDANDTSLTVVFTDPVSAGSCTYYSRATLEVDKTALQDMRSGHEYATPFTITTPRFMSADFVLSTFFGKDYLRVQSLRLTDREMNHLISIDFGAPREMTLSCRERAVLGGVLEEAMPYDESSARFAYYRLLKEHYQVLRLDSPARERGVEHLLSKAGGIMKEWQTEDSDLAVGLGSLMMDYAGMLNDRSTWERIARSHIEHVKLLCDDRQYTMELRLALTASGENGLHDLFGHLSSLLYGYATDKYLFEEAFMLGREYRADRPEYSVPLLRAAREKAEGVEAGLAAGLEFAHALLRLSEKASVDWKWPVSACRGYYDAALEEHDSLRGETDAESLAPFHDKTSEIEQLRDSLSNRLLQGR